jgi:hypothetical protein
MLEKCHILYFYNEDYQKLETTTNITRSVCGFHINLCELNGHSGLLSKKSNEITWKFLKREFDYQNPV